MRSWAFFIFEAATISIAFVILRVLCTLLILLRISLEPAMSAYPASASPGALRTATAPAVRRFALPTVNWQLTPDQYAPFFRKSSTAAARAFSSSAERSFVFSMLSISAAYLLFRYARSADSNASALSTGTSS